MANSLNSYISGLASNYFISHGSTERNQIVSSINTVKSRLKSHFGSKVKNVLIFGSWDRDTTIPRKYDSNSDVDIMIVFDHDSINNTAETYRKWVLEFAQSKYSTSLSKKDFPTVRLDMTHITLDLIPTKITTLLDAFYFYYIPDSGNKWMSTQPFKFSQEVKNKNTQKNSIVKPVLRLIKAWNAHIGYPFESFILEKYVLENVSWFWISTIEEGFFAAINNLPTWDVTLTQKSKVQSAQSNLSTIKSFLEKGDVAMAKLWLHILLPK